MSSLFLSQIILLLAAVSATLALPQGARPAAPADLSHKPYGYQYGVEDTDTNNSFKKSEAKDASGAVTGSYVIALPDGRIQTTKYTADPVLGYRAEVTYQGSPVYPPVKPGQLAPADIAPYVPVGYLG